RRPRACPRPARRQRAGGRSRAAQRDGRQLFARARRLPLVERQCQCPQSQLIRLTHKSHTRNRHVSTDDKYTCAEVIQSWGLYRDQLRWAELLETFTPDGTIAVSWFRGSFPDFVKACQSRTGRAGSAKHLLQPSVVQIAGARALAETSTVILVRQNVE